MTAGVFSITLDGTALAESEFSLPPGQDPSQNVSLVLVARTSPFSSAPDYIALIDKLDVGDYVSVVKYRGDIETPRSGELEILPFTQVDGTRIGCTEGVLAVRVAVRSLAARYFSIKRCWRAWVNSKASSIFAGRAQGDFDC